MLSQVPPSRNRVNQRYTVRQGGMLLAISPHAIPARSTKEMAFTTSRIG